MAQLLTFRLARTDSTQSWGFRLQGGKDFGTPLLIQKVNCESLAEKAGLRVGDALIRVNNVEVAEQRHKDAQDVIIGAGNAFDVTVQRGGLVTWKPSVSPVGSIPSPNPHIAGSPVPVTKTSLAATYKPGSRPPHGFNSASKPFSPQLNGGGGGGGGHEAENGPVKAIVNKQYNSPVGIYSDESIAETLSAQAEVLAGGVLGVNFKKNEKNYNSEGSEVFKMLREAESERKWPEPADEPRPEAHEAPVPGLRSVSAPRPKSPSADSTLAPGKNICADCERLIVGVFVRIKGKNLHVECFKCATCGTSLKNVGYYSINEKLYCDIHAKMIARQNPPAPNLEPVTEPPQSRPVDPTPWKSSPSPSRFSNPSSHANVNRFMSPSQHLTSTNGDTVDSHHQHIGNHTFSTSSTNSNNVDTLKTEARTVVEKTVNSSNSVCRVYATNVTAASTSYFPSQRLPFLRPRNEDCKPKPSVHEQKATRNVTSSKCSTIVTSESTIAENRRVLNEDLRRHISTVVPTGASPPPKQEPHAQPLSGSTAAAPASVAASCGPCVKQNPIAQLSSTPPGREDGEGNHDVTQERISVAPANRKSPTPKQNAPPTPARVEYAESDIEDRGALQSACSREIARILSDFGGCESSDDLDGEEDTRDEKYQVREEPRCEWRNTPKDARFVEVGTPHGVRPLSPCQPVPRPDQVVVFPPPAPSFYPQSGARLSASPSLSHSSYEALETCAIRSTNFSKAHEYNTFDESRSATDIGNNRTRSVSNLSNNNNGEEINTEDVCHSAPRTTSTRQVQNNDQAITDESRTSTPASLPDAPIRGGLFATALTIAPERPYTPLQSTTAATIFTDSPSLPELGECYVPKLENDSCAIPFSSNYNNEQRRPRLADALTTIGGVTQPPKAPTTDEEAPALPSLDDDPSAILRRPSSVVEKRDDKKVDDGRLSRSSLRQELEMKMDEKRAIWRAERRPRTFDSEVASAQSSRLASPAFTGRRPTPTNFEATVSTCSKVFGAETKAATAAATTATTTTHCATLSCTRTRRSRSRSPLPSPSLTLQGSTTNQSFQEELTESSTTLVVTSVRESTTAPVAQSTATTICHRTRQHEAQPEPPQQPQQQQQKHQQQHQEKPQQLQKQQQQQQQKQQQLQQEKLQQQQQQQQQHEKTQQLQKQQQQQQQQQQKQQQQQQEKPQLPKQQQQQQQKQQQQQQEKPQQQQKQQQQQQHPKQQPQQPHREQNSPRMDTQARPAQLRRSPQPSPKQPRRRLSSVAEEHGTGGSCAAERTTSRQAAASLLARRLGSLQRGSSATNVFASPSPACASTTASTDAGARRTNKPAFVGDDSGSGGAKPPGAFPTSTAAPSSAGLSAPRRGKGVWNPQNASPGARIPLCARCNSQIRGPFVTALGKIWCPEHFLCVNDKCGRSLLDIGFVEEPTGLYCEYCFERYLAPTCAKCSSKIKADCLNAIGKHFHPNCFTCAYCGRLFGNDPFFLEDGLPYCENDWNELFTTKCFACGFPIEAGDRWVEALETNYHSPCFNCTKYQTMQVNASQKHRQPSPTSSISKSTNNRTKRKSRWKLKFHHQALPAEYLNHYEASLQNDAKHKIPTPPSASASHTSTTSPTSSSLSTTCIATPAVRAATATKCSKVSAPKSNFCAAPQPQLSSSTLPPNLQSTVRYKDLPYMGEMTLDNARPRRGRKPKKADICHLIYKNYGTTVVDEPLNLCLRDLQLGNVAVESGAGGSNGANDISVHKFKFVGGATPTLLEKRSATLDGSTNGTHRMSEKKSRSRSHELKRKSRKSLAREKLEKTFEERGFLIQTQQLESAQGATYCKFRQLRKFTRYLFRSWKHHLPGDVVNNNEA